jgi:predicted Zn finger-like uncharacterized protein
MRLVSRCPDCGTSFRVVADQLRIAQGWVRCGHCQTVYQAQDTLSTVREEIGDAATHSDGTPASSGSVATHGEERARDPVAKASAMERIAAIIATRRGQARMADEQSVAAQPAAETEPDNPAAGLPPPPADAPIPAELEEAEDHAVSASAPEAMDTATVAAAIEADMLAPEFDSAHSFVPEPPESDEGDDAEPAEPASEPEQTHSPEAIEPDEGGDTKPQEAVCEPEQRYPLEPEELDENGEAEPPDFDTDTPEEIPSEPAEELPPLIPAFLLLDGNASKEDVDGSAGQVASADDAAENDAAAESGPEADFAALGATAEDPATQAAVPVQAADAAEAAGEEKFSFVRDAERRAFWRKPLVRVGLSLSVGLGLLVLAGQWTYHQRSSLYARVPLARLALDAVCRPLNCRIAPWQNIHAVEIETSEFLKNADSSYALHVTLRNSSPHPVAMPALELSLLDADQQLVVKRVIASDPAVPVPPILPPRGQWNIDATVDVRLPANVVRYDISGYRLTIFYP